MKLAEQSCRPVTAGTAPFSVKEAEALLLQVPSWSLEDGKIKREFRFRDFQQAVQFANKIAEIAVEQDHHPDITISYNKVTLVLTTHKIGGLSMNDFIMAARIDLLGGGQRSEKAA